MDRAAIQERFGIIGTSPAIQGVIDRVRQVAQTDITVLLEGESGVGKELVAQAIHELSRRRHGPLVIVNCGAIPEGLIESELFGSEKGAYTGSVERRTGYFEEADNGSIFLDEIGEMPAQAQVRLLRVLETGQFSRIGSSVTRRADVRIIGATNKILADEVRAGRFREDLYYRLSTVLIRIPPLRERKEDIRPIFDAFLYRFSQKYNAQLKRLDEGAVDLLIRYGWPGNVRELRNVAEQVVVLVRGETVSAEHLRPFLRGVSGSRELQLARRDAPSDPGQERELLYRALLEMRLEMRDLKGMVRALLERGEAPPREVMSREPFGREAFSRPEPGFEDDFLILPRQEEDFSPIEDAPFEIEEPRRPPEEAAPPAAPAGRTNGAALPPEEEPLPTLYDAERALITRALEKFDGNRRQTARALGISERTLYRKIKELEEGVREEEE